MKSIRKVFMLAVIMMLLTIRVPSSAQEAYGNVSTVSSKDSCATEAEFAAAISHDYSEKEIVQSLNELGIEVPTSSKVSIIESEDHMQDCFQIIEINKEIVTVTCIVPFEEVNNEMEQISASTVLAASTISKVGSHSFYSVTGTAYYYRKTSSTGEYTYKPYKIEGVSTNSKVTYFKLEHSASGTSSIGADSYYNALTQSNPTVNQMYSVTKTHPRFMNLANGISQYHTFNFTVKYNGMTYTTQYSIEPF